MRHRHPRAPGTTLRTLCLLALLAPVAPLVAQTPVRLTGREMVLVRVIDASNNAPVEGAEVWMGSDRASSDSLGRALVGAPRGRGTLVVRRLGYTDQRFSLAAGIPEVEVVLAPQPVRMGMVQASARPLPRSLPLQRFYERMQRGHGSFVTRENIDRRKPRRLADLFHEIPGVRVVPSSRGERLIMDGTTPYMWGSRGARTGDCPVQYYLEGVSWEPDAPGVLGDDVRPNEVEGIEVYRRLSEVPAEYRKAGSECGVVLIWLKERA
jgi:hypothetical protein